MCEHHYKRYLFLKERKEHDTCYKINKKLPRIFKRPKKKIGYGDKTLTKYKKGTSYIEKEGFKKDAYKKVKIILKSAGWRNLENRFQRYGLVQYLVANPGIIREIYSLYSWLDFYKKNASHVQRLNKNSDIRLNLQLCMINTGDDLFLSNFIVLPAVMKNKFKEKILKKLITQESEANIPRKSLRKHLFLKIGKKGTIALLLSLKEKTTKHPGYKLKSNYYKDTELMPPIFFVICGELGRTEWSLWGRILLRLFKSDKYTLFQLEIIGIYMMVKRINNHSDDDENDTLINELFNGWHPEPKLFISYLKNKLNIKNTLGLVRIYNSFFTKKIITYNEASNTVRWDNGIIENLASKTVF